MATSTCQKCGGTEFEGKEHTPIECNYKYVFIQCASCGAVVGVVNFYHNEQLIHDLANNLDEIKNKINSLENTLKHKF